MMSFVSSRKAPIDPKSLLFLVKPLTHVDAHTSRHAGMLKPSGYNFRFLVSCKALAARAVLVRSLLRMCPVCAQLCALRTGTQNYTLGFTAPSPS
jgi:hypothetical protein